MKTKMWFFCSALFFVTNITASKADDFSNLPVNENQSTCPTIGAIRWDAWFGNKDFVGQAVIRSLTPDKWHYRLPLCAKVIAPDNIYIDCASQGVMDQEIAYAKHAEIDYWAFVLYEENVQLSQGLKNYLSSNKKVDINFSLITEFERSWLPGNYSKSIDRIIELMSDSSYQKVLNQRPLIYIGFFSEQWLSKWGNSDAVKTAFAEFRQKANEYNLKNPYIVVMDNDPKRAKQLADNFGFDAISTYANPGDGGQAPHQYQMLAANTEQYWRRSKATGAQIVPVVMTGWDRRPRVENPVPWEQGKGDISKYYQPPTPFELTQHLKKSLDWVKSESNYTEAKTLIVYAWNEFDEGGWLAPTALEGTARIDALAAMVGRECPTKH
jgi:hypothetical protein